LEAARGRRADPDGPLGGAARDRGRGRVAALRGRELRDRRDRPGRRRLPGAVAGAISSRHPTNRKERAMPLIDVRLYDHRVTEESVPKIIEKLTDALHESSGAAKEHIHVIVTGVSPKHWGTNGKPGS